MFRFLKGLAIALLFVGYIIIVISFACSVAANAGEVSYLPQGEVDVFYLPFTKHFTECKRKKCLNVRVEKEWHSYAETFNDGTSGYRNVLETRYRGDYREDNHVIGITNRGYSAFVMKNSYNRWSAFLGIQYSYDTTVNIRGFATVGLATGYSHVTASVLGLSPSVYLGVDLHPSNDQWGIIITGIPSHDGVVNVGFRVTI